MHLAQLVLGELRFWRYGFWECDLPPFFLFSWEHPLHLLSWWTRKRFYTSKMNKQKLPKKKKKKQKKKLLPSLLCHAIQYARIRFKSIPPMRHFFSWYLPLLP